MTTVQLLYSYHTVRAELVSYIYDSYDIIVVYINILLYFYIIFYILYFIIYMWPQIILYEYIIIYKQQAEIYIS